MTADHGPRISAHKF